MKYCQMKRRTLIPREKRNSDCSSLRAAAHLGDVSQVDLLLRGFFVSSPNRLPSDTVPDGHALHLAASDGHVRVVEELLKIGANPEASDLQGFRPLHMAAQQGSVEVVELLKVFGANMEAQTVIGLQAVHLAAKNGHVQILKQLQRYRCNLASRDNYSATPLHHAAQHGKLNAVEWLIGAGVYRDIQDEEGKTAVDRAKESNYHQVVRVLDAAILKKASEVTATRRNIPFQPKSSQTIPRIKPNASGEIPPTTDPSPAKIQISSESSLNSPSSPSRYQLPSFFFNPPNNSPPRPAPSRSLTTPTSTSAPQCTPKQGTQSQTPPLSPLPAQIPARIKSSNGMCTSKLEPPESSLIPSSSEPRPPPDIHPLRPPSHTTDKTLILSDNSAIPILSADEEKKPMTKDIKKSLNQSYRKRSKKTSAKIKGKCVKVLRKVIPIPCKTGKGNQQDLEAELGRQNEENNTMPDSHKIGVGGGKLPVHESPPTYWGHFQQEAPVMSLQVQPATQPYPEGPGIYTCTTNPRGHVLILNNKSFKDEQYPTRFGSECDITNLENVYHQMGYKVNTRWDLSRSATLEFFRKASQSPHLRHVSCLFVFIMSHGDGPRTFFTHDLETVTLDEVLSFFLDQSCPLLKGKPKIFFSHFCRGVDEEIRPRLFPEAKREAYKDMLCIYSSTPGFQAYRHPTLGTPSIRALCKALAGYAHCKMLCQVIKEFQGLYEKMEGATSPEVQNFSFAKDFFLNPTGNQRTVTVR